MNRTRFVLGGLLLILLALMLGSGGGTAVNAAAIDLVAGDIAIIGFNTTNPDEFAIVLMTNILSGEQIQFTDNGWLASGSLRSGEGFMTWTAPSDLCAGTVIIPAIPASPGNFLFSASGDQLLAYQGDSTSPTFIYGLNDEGAGVWQADATSSNTSALPTGLTNGTTAVALNEAANVIYNGITSGTRAALLAAISDNSNWIGSSSRYTMPTGPFTVTDAAPCGGDAAPSVSSTTPANSATGVAVDGNIDITFSEGVTLDANWFDITCGTSGGHTAVVSGGPSAWTLNPDTDFTNGELCTVTIDDVAVHDTDLDDPPDTMTADYTFSFTIVGGGCGVGNTLISAVQGSGSISPLNGNSVFIEGVVVGDFQPSTELNGFFVQEEVADQDANPLTSEGIFVYAPGSTAVNPGDLVQVEGTVDEYFNLTELTSVVGVTVCNTGLSVPATPVNLPFASSTYMEQFEGMLITLPQTLYATEHYNLGRGGYVVMSSSDRLNQPTQVALPGAPATIVQAANDLNRIIIDDGSLAQNPDPIVYPAPGLTAANTLRGGYSASGITGVLTYSYDGWSGSPNNYRLHTTATPTFSSAPNPRTVAPETIPGTIRVASFNVLNYFNGDGLGGGFPTSRGADTAAEFTRQRDKIIQAILGLDADVIGLMEIENDYGDLGLSAIADLVSGLNGATGSPGDFAYIDPGGALGGDEIAVGIIYRISVVTPTGSPASISSGAFAHRNRQPLAQTFDAGGELFTVVVNHLKSKGSACDDGTVNDPDGVFPDDPDTGDGQGNCNLTRVIAVNQLLTWLGTDPTGSGDPDVLIMGDLNAYAKEDPITTLEGAGYVNLEVQEMGYDSYSYVFDGQWGSLDHILGNGSMTAQVAGVTVWHINSDEPRSLDYNVEFKSPGQVVSLYNDDPYRASDHDPVIVGLLLGSQSDYSDLPASYGVAWHLDNSSVWLGSTRTNETIFTPNHDNVTGGDGSDDGVAVNGPWADGVNGGTLDVTVSGSGNGCLYGWIDWDNDGVFDRSTAVSNLEYIIRGATTGTGSYSFEVPAGTFNGSGPNRSFNIRVRLYENCSSGPTGPGIGGEVEDIQAGFSPTAITLQNMGVNGRTPLLQIVLLAVVMLLALSVYLLVVRNRGRIMN